MYLTGEGSIRSVPMDDQTVTKTTEATTEATTEETTTGADELITDELLVEEISIDGMCGVY